MFENEKCYKNTLNFPKFLNMLNIALEGYWYLKPNS
jgi:hypothetical protein